MTAGTTTATTNLAWRAALNQALHGAMERDSSVVLFGEDVCDPTGGVMKVTEGLSTRFGDRVRDTPISEIAIGGAAVGAAVAGLRPVAEIMIMDFLSIAMDQLQNHGAQLHYITNGTIKVPLTVRVTCVAGSGGWRHALSVAGNVADALSRGFKVAMPSSPAEAKGLLSACIYDDDPCVFVEHTASYGIQGPVPVGDYVLPVGVANVARSGEDVTLISYGPTTSMCLEAASELDKVGTNAEVIDLRWLLPLDTSTILASVAKTRCAVVVHQAREFLVGAEISALIHENLFTQLVHPVLRVGANFTPVPAAPVLEQAHFPSVADIVDAAMQATSNRKDT